MITPEEIQSKEFGKGVMGYNQEEVDIFLDTLTEDYANLIKENEAQKAVIEGLNTTLEGYKAQEGSILQTLEAAKALMNDISASAEKRADILLKNAQLDADLKIRQATDSLERLKDEEANLSRRVASIRTRFKSILEAELERFDDLSDEIFADIDLSAGKDEDVTMVKGFEAQSTEMSDEEMFKTLTNFRGDE